MDSFATVAAGGVAGTCPKRTSGLRRVTAGQLWLPSTSGDAAHQCAPLSHFNGATLKTRVWNKVLAAHHSTMLTFTSYRSTIYISQVYSTLKLSNRATCFIVSCFDYDTMAPRNNSGFYKVSRTRLHPGNVLRGFSPVLVSDSAIVTPLNGPHTATLQGYTFSHSVCDDLKVKDQRRKKDEKRRPVKRWPA